MLCKYFVNVSLLSSSLIICLFQGWIGFTLLSEMPSYLTDVLDFDIQTAGVLCIFPYLALFISSIAFGKIFDYLQKVLGFEIATIRFTAQLIASAASSLLLIICGFCDKAPYGAVVLMILSQATFGAAQCGIGCAYTDVAPFFSSPLNSLGNTIGAVAGICGPIVVASFITQFEGAWGWRLAFFLTGVFSLISLTLWAIFMRHTIVPELNTPLPRKLSIS